MRLFLAIDLPAEVREFLAAMTRPPIGGLKWVPTGQLHITLKFLGDVEADRVPALATALAQVPKPGSLRLAAAGQLLLPEHGPVRILGLRVGSSFHGLNKLAEALESACEPLGFGREDRPFLGHITLARAKSPLPRSRFNFPLPGMEWFASSFVLMESQLSSKGPTYRVAERFPLAVPQ